MDNANDRAYDRAYEMGLIPEYTAYCPECRGECRCGYVEYLAETEAAEEARVDAIAQAQDEQAAHAECSC